MNIFCKNIQQTPFYEKSNVYYNVNSQLFTYFSRLKYVFIRNDLIMKSSTLLHGKKFQPRTIINTVKKIKTRIILLGLTTILYGNLFAQLFPNPVTLATGQGPVGSIDPLWLASPWYTSSPPNPMGLTYSSTLINNNCAPGSWVNPAALPAPMNNGNWITGSESNCATNSTSGYRYFRLTLNLPADCNGFSVAVAGNYVLDLVGYVDNQITDVFINGNSTGISGGSYSLGSELNVHLIGPWVAGLNYVDILVYNVPSGAPGNNPYGLLMVADATSAGGTDTDNDGISDLDDQCPCEPGNNPYGCVDPVFNTCDVAAVRAAFLAAGCIELNGCVDNCSMYFLNPAANTGSGAQAFAQTLGANLVSIQSAAENQCILDELIRLNHSGVIWIGFNDEAVEGQFVWYDQSPVVYTNWAPGEPNQSGNEDCVQIYPGGANPGTWNDLSCTSANAKSIIEVNLCPVINAGSNVSVCKGTSTTLNATSTLFGSSPYTYSWSNSISTRTQSVAPAATSDYIITTVDRYNCSAKDTVTVTVNELPIVTAGPDITVCPQETVTLSGAGATSYAWNNSITNGVAFTPNVPSQEYIVTGTDANNCIGKDTVNVFVELNGCPNFPNNFTCDIDAIRQAFTTAGCIEMVGCVSECSMYFLNQQSLSGSDAQNFAQTLGANLVSIQSQAENDCIVSSLVNLGLNSVSDVIWIGFNDEAVEGDFVWYDQSPVVYTNWASGEPNNSGNNEDCTQIYPNGSWNDLPCGIGNAKSVIEVNLCPVMNVGADRIICNGESVTLSSTPTILGSSPYTYQWSNGDNTISTTVSPSQTSEYSVISSDRYNCTTGDTAKVTVNPLPIAAFNSQNDCIGTTSNFTNQSNGNGGVISQLDWNFGDGTTSVSNNPQHTYGNSTTFTVTLTATTSEGCSDTESHDVIIYPIPPAPSITNNSPLECPGDELKMQLNYTANATYHWSGPNNFSSENASISFPADYINEGNYTAYITVNNCPSPSVSTLVEILGSLEAFTDDFPNVITPNGDGINDVLDLDQFFTSCLKYKLILWNRWGNLIYEQELGGTPFSGKDTAGKVLADGIYFYKLNFGEKEKTGFITVIR